jgi:hypothetical protein
VAGRYLRAETIKFSIGTKIGIFYQLECGKVGMLKSCNMIRPGT